MWTKEETEQEIETKAYLEAYGKLKKEKKYMNWTIRIVVLPWVNSESRHTNIFMEILEKIITNTTRNNENEAHELENILG